MESIKCGRDGRRWNSRMEGWRQMRDEKDTENEKK